MSSELQGCLCFHPQNGNPEDTICHNVILAFYEVVEKLGDTPKLKCPHNPFAASYELDTSQRFILIYFDTSEIWKDKWIRDVENQLRNFRKNQRQFELHILLVHNNFLRVWRLDKKIVYRILDLNMKDREHYRPCDIDGSIYRGYALPFDMGQVYIDYCNPEFARSLSHTFIERATTIRNQSSSNAALLQYDFVSGTSSASKDMPVYDGLHWELKKTGSEPPKSGIKIRDRHDELVKAIQSAKSVNDTCDANVRVITSSSIIPADLTHYHYIEIKKDNGQKEYYIPLTHLTYLQNSICKSAVDNFTSATHSTGHLGALLCMDVGMGKTRTGLKICSNIACLHRNTRQPKTLLLILAPTRTFENFENSRDRMSLRKYSELKNMSLCDVNCVDAIFIGISDIYSIKRMGRHAIDTTIKDFDTSFMTTIIQGLDNKILEMNENHEPRPFILMVDEVHNAVKPSTDIHKFVRAFSNHKSCIYRLFMTATPIIKESDGKHILRLMKKELSTGCEFTCLTTNTADDARSNIYTCKGYNMSIFWEMSRSKKYPFEIHKRYTVPMQHSNFNKIKEKQNLDCQSYLFSIFAYCNMVTKYTKELRNTKIITFPNIPLIPDENKQSWLMYTKEKYNATHNKDVLKKVNQFYKMIYSAFSSMDYPGIDSIFEKDDQMSHLLSLDTQSFDKDNLVNVLDQLRILSKIVQKADWYYSPIQVYKHKKFNMNVFDQESKSIALRDHKLMDQVMKIVQECIKKKELPIVIYEDRVELGANQIFNHLIKMFPQNKASLALLTGKSCIIGDDRDQSVLRKYEILLDAKPSKYLSIRERYARVIEKWFEKGRIDILIFSGVISEGLNLKAYDTFPEKIETSRKCQHIIDTSSFHFFKIHNQIMSYKLYGSHEFEKKRPISINFSEYGNGHLARIDGKTTYMSRYINPVKHFINISGSWDWKTIHQAVGRVIRNDSHPLNFDSDGNVDSYYPHDVVKVHNIVLVNPDICSTSSIKNGHITTYDEHTEQIMLKKLKETEKLTSALSGFCSFCLKKTCADPFKSKLLAASNDIYKYNNLKKKCPILGSNDKLSMRRGSAIEEVYDLF